MHQLIADEKDTLALKQEQARLKREQAKQNRPAKKTLNFRLSMSSDGGMIIETTSKQLKLSPPSLFRQFDRYASDAEEVSGR